MKPLKDEAFYKSIYDNSLDGLAYCRMVFDENEKPVDFIYLDVNENFAALTGLTGVAGRKVTEIFPGIKESNPELFEIYGRVSLSGKPERFESYIAPLAKWFLVEAYGPEKGNFVAIFQDITGEKATIEDLVKFKLAVEEASDHVIITDVDGKILYANNAAERITGYSREEMAGKTPRLWGGRMEKDFYANFWKTIKTEKQPFFGEINNRRKNGELYVAEIHIAPVVSNGNIRFFVGIERDITKEKQIDRAKTEFVSLASHQLRTPLTAINWYAEMLLGGDVGPLGPKQKEYLDEIYGSGLRMVRLVNALLNVSRIDLGTFAIAPVQTDISAIAHEVIKESAPLVTSRREHVIEDFDESIGPLDVDPDLMTIIFQNFFTNAAKYTPEEGTITVSIGKKRASLSLA